MGHRYTGYGYVVQFWAVKDFKPKPKEFFIKVRRLTAVPSFRTFSLQPGKYVGGKSSIKFRLRKKPLIPHHGTIYPIYLYVSLRIKDVPLRLIIGRKSGICIITRRENVKPEFLQKHKEIPTIYFAIFKDDKP
ncbi:hypothetical protein [Sulfurisphaera ohwakuensis]|uniref:Uncharacterized protein n=1 Tax=Sulfurisphaera ohwakuensis TaxID=69656 RepID=A0A650CK98_SULOH|nr:hypothetical protein [Sulfurisphaera ohwakuensis]MBB5255209.1 hypothetical protein [Sulfurisphaera ohwakuensis]QGR18229.1 hypothetical protein D1869_14310 [Sulfurisphaera ohwakuensis]